MKIFVNGQEKEIKVFCLCSSKKMSHKDVCELSGLRYSPYLTVTYRDACGKKSEGSLTHEQFIKVKNKTKIDVADTSNA